MDLLRRLAELGGAARRCDLVASSSDHRELAGLVEHALVVRHGAGCYALPHAAAWIIHARQFRGALTCVSWAERAGLFVLERPTRTHLAVPPGRSPSRSPHRCASHVVLHRTAALRAGSVPEPPVMAAAGAAACLLKCLEPIAATVAIDSALNRGLLESAEVRAELVGPGSRAALQVLGRCDARSQSGLESIARLVLGDADLHLAVNVHVAGVGWVDLLVEGRLVVELDGFEHHATRRGFTEDRRRDRELVARGYRVLRFTYEEVVRDPQQIVRAVIAALEGPWVPPGAMALPSRRRAWRTSRPQAGEM